MILLTVSPEPYVRELAHIAAVAWTKLMLYKRIVQQFYTVHSWLGYSQTEFLRSFPAQYEIHYLAARFD